MCRENAPGGGPTAAAPGVPHSPLRRSNGANGTTGEQNNLNLVGSCCLIGGDTPGVLFTEGLTQTDVFGRNVTGDVVISWVNGDGSWQGPMTVASP
jgi:hypothetical protein